MEDIYNNKTSFITLKPLKKKLLVFIIIIILFFLFGLYLIITTKIYDNYQTKGYIMCEDTCYLITYIPSNIPDNNIYFNNKSYDYQIISKEIYFDEQAMNSLIKLTLKVSHDFLNKEIINLNFYYNKERIITKIKERMF